MNKVRRLLCWVAPAALSIAFVACEWQGQSSDGGWNTSAGWIDYSGVYRGAQGGAVVTDFAVQSTTTSGGQLIFISNEQVGAGDGNSTTFAGQLSNVPVVAGSVQVVAAGFTLVDDGNKHLVGNGGSSGSIDYNTGAWSIDLNGVPLANGAKIFASYAFTSTSSGGATTGSQLDVRSLTVQQQGNTMELHDNNGNVYSGVLGQASESQPVTPTATSASSGQGTAQISVVTQFSAEGVNGGHHVTLQGAFQAQVIVYFAQQSTTDANGNTSITWTELYRTATLSMEGTWVQDNGITGNISGQGPADQKIVVVTPTGVAG